MLCSVVHVSLIMMNLVEGEDEIESDEPVGYRTRKRKPVESVAGGSSIAKKGKKKMEDEVLDGKAKSKKRRNALRSSSYLHVS